MNAEDVRYSCYEIEHETVKLSPAKFGSAKKKHLFVAQRLTRLNSKSLLR